MTADAKNVGEPHWDREQLLRTAAGYWEACTLQAAVVLDVFTLLGDGVFTAAEVKKRLQARGRGVELLLNALTAMGLLEHKEEGYANTLASRQYLCADSNGYLGPIVRHHHHLVDAWSRLPAAVRRGRPTRRRRSARSGEETESFLLGMHVNAMGVAPKVARLVDLRGRRHLLDLGGGTGTYAVHFCQAYPQLQATVFDLPATRPYAEKMLARFNLGGRIRFVPGDYLHDEIPGRYDVAWLSHILHGEGPDECARIIAKAVAAIEPGGLIMVQDFFLNDRRDGPRGPAIFALNMLVNTPKGRSYSAAEVEAMLQRAGVQRLRRLDFAGPRGAAIICGEIGEK